MKIYILSTFLALALAVQAQGNLKIRGKIVTQNPYSKEQMPLASVDLVLYSNASGSWQVIAKTVTDPNGMYYFYDLPVGTYFLQVRGTKNFQITISPPQEVGAFVDVPVLTF